MQTSQYATKTWGRSARVSLGAFLGCLSLLTLSPLLVLYFYISAFSFNCSLLEPLYTVWNGQLTWNMLPKFDLKAIYIFTFWIALQVSLALIPDILNKLLPKYKGGTINGAVTPSGFQHKYNINGLQAWLISNLLFIAGAFLFHWFPATIIFNNWGSLLILANIAGYSIATFAYAKAYFFPSFADDRKFSRNFIYDYFMGIELNPRIGLIDLKLFCNGRPGIIAWSIINISFAAAQYERYGFISNSMLIVNLLHGLYILYFFWKESWYLNTIDIHHDHFGWMLGWGDFVWLPYMYTLQGLYLVFNPVNLSPINALFITGLGLLGFWIFLSSNNQKDRFKRNELTSIWGKPINSIECTYTTKDGLIRQSKLLASGWWGIARHMNYTGDLLLSLAYSLACGLDSLFPYFYFIYLTILLVHRCLRDEDRCKIKYGNAWWTYCKQVPYRLIPNIF